MNQLHLVKRKMQGDWYACDDCFFINVCKETPELKNLLGQCEEDGVYWVKEEGIIPFSLDNNRGNK